MGSKRTVLGLRGAEIPYTKVKSCRAGKSKDSRGEEEIKKGREKKNGSQEEKIMNKKKKKGRERMNVTVNRSSYRGTRLARDELEKKKKKGRRDETSPEDEKKYN